MVLVDYRKALDMVDHGVLFKKLQLYGIANQELQWCHSYLSDRKQVVHVRGAQSCDALVKHGIPQGSILGPQFSIIFINDLPLHVDVQVDLYADDTPHVTNFSSLERLLNRSVSEIQSWADANKLPLNESRRATDLHPRHQSLQSQQTIQGL